MVQYRIDGIKSIYYILLNTQSLAVGYQKEYNE